MSLRFVQVASERDKSAGLGGRGKMLDSVQIVRELDIDAWDGFLEGNPHANVFHSRHMFQSFQRAARCKPFLWAAVGRDGRVLAMLQPVEITVWNGPLRYLTTRAVAHGSVLCEPGPDGERALGTLLEAYKSETKHRLLFTELRNLADMSGHQHVMRECGFRYEDHLNFLIDLRRPARDLWGGIRGSARRNIEKAQRQNVRIDKARCPQDVIDAYGVLTKGYRRIQVPLPDISLFESAFEIMRPLRMFDILLARVDEQTIGVVTLLVYKEVMLYWYSAFLREYSEYRPADLLVWRALELGQQYGCRTFDFGGGGKPAEEYGVRDFKAKFGGVLVNFGRNTCVHAPRILMLSRAGYRIARRFL